MAVKKPSEKAVELVIEAKRKEWEEVIAILRERYR